MSRQMNSGRIAKNTILLYIRTILILVISLYTSRVVLLKLGVTDYGIYNVVGGFVGMFSVISSALSGSIGRFVTVELGREDYTRLKAVFSTGVIIQVAIACVVLILAEVFGIWFLNNKLNVPAERLHAATWVFHCSIITFCISLISGPYMSCIIAHERMTAFAYISIIESVLKLIVCLLLGISVADRLIFYATLLVVVAVFIRFLYATYSKHHFEECHFHFQFDVSLFKEMLGFAGWNFVTNAAWIFNTQGVNMLMNIYFGVALNAARGVASQVETAVSQFVHNFTTALHPQITKSFSAGEKDDMFLLMCRGAKVSYLLLLILSLPVLLETEFLLELWLKKVPAYSVLFVRLSIICTMVNMLTHSFYVGCLATGQIRRYVISVTAVGVLVFPITWVCYHCVMPAFVSYLVFIVVYAVVDVVCLLNAKRLLDFPLRMFFSKVLKPIVVSTMVGCIVPFLCSQCLPKDLLHIVLVCFACILSTMLSSFFCGMTSRERDSFRNLIVNKLKKINKSQ